MVRRPVRRRLAERAASCACATRRSTPGRPPGVRRAAPGPGDGDQVATRSNGSGITRYTSLTPVEGMEGDIDAMSLWAGQSVALARRCSRRRRSWPSSSRGCSLGLWNAPSRSPACRPSPRSSIARRRSTGSSARRRGCRQRRGARRLPRDVRSGVSVVALGEGVRGLAERRREARVRADRAELRRRRLAVGAAARRGREGARRLARHRRERGRARAARDDLQLAPLPLA